MNSDDNRFPQLSNELTTVSDDQFINSIRLTLARTTEAFPLFDDYYSIFFGDAWSTFDQIQDIPFLPVSIFKSFDIVDMVESVHRVVESSGTSGAASRIPITKEDSRRMQAQLIADATKQIGAERRPVFVVGERADGSSPLNGGWAAVAGLISFATKIHYFFKRGSFDQEVAELFFQSTSPVLLIGTTVNCWFKLLPELSRLGGRAPSHSCLIHGGGWKKSESLKVDDVHFKKAFHEQIGLARTIDFYGMTEQLGSVAFECIYGHKHLSPATRIVARDPQTLIPLDFGCKGILHTISTLPLGYPGSSLLTEDVGLLFPAEECPCGSSTDFVEIHGRLKNSPKKGCSTS